MTLQCTEYVWDAAPWVRQMGHYPDARYWLPVADSAGLTIGHDPVEGAVVVYAPGGLYDGQFGHVAIVAQVLDVLRFVVSESNYPEGAEPHTGRVSTMDHVAGFILPPPPPKPVEPVHEVSEVGQFVRFQAPGSAEHFVWVDPATGQAHIDHRLDGSIPAAGPRGSWVTEPIKLRTDVAAGGFDPHNSGVVVEAIGSELHLWGRGVAAADGSVPTPRLHYAYNVSGDDKWDGLSA